MNELPTYVTADLVDQIKAAAAKAAPTEMCGAIYRKSAGEIVFEAVDNTHPVPTAYFKIDARKVAEWNIANYAVLCYVHSHPTTSSDASDDDIASMNIHKRPYLILGQHGDLQFHQPTRAPLVGRGYVHGTQDCYGIVRDYYSRELGITLPDIERQDMWWTEQGYGELYLDNYEAFGFVRVPLADIRRHDVLLCRWGDTRRVNHALIYLASDGELLSEITDPCIGARLCLHHPYNGKSGRFILGQTRLDTVVHAIRHRSLLDDNA